MSFASKACLVVGSGLTTLATVKEHVPASLAYCPEVLAKEVENLSDLENHLDSKDVICAGPGLGKNFWAEQMIYKSFESASKRNIPLVLDADGLNTDFLESENIEDIDCFIAATEDEQTNIVASLLVKHYNIKQVIIHISTTSYIQAIRRIGVDAVVCKNISVVNEYPIPRLVSNNFEYIPNLFLKLTI